MLLEPNDLYEKLEFDKILSLLDEACFGEQGRLVCNALAPSSDLNKINKSLAEAHEFVLSLENKDRIPIGIYEEIKEELRMLEIAGFVLPEEGLQKINVLLLFVRGIFKFFTAE